MNKLKNMELISRSVVFQDEIFAFERYCDTFELDVYCKQKCVCQMLIADIPKISDRHI